MAKYCDVHTNIARFYITEVDAHRKRTGGGFIHPKWEENLLKQQARTAQTILGFTVSACLGEARHAYRPAPGGRLAEGDEDDYRWRAIYEIIYRALKLKPTAGLSGHDYRNMLFKVNLPLKLYPKILEALTFVFGNLHWKEGGYGGEKWAAICRAGIACFKASLGDDLSKLTLKTDRLVNLCHNGGIFLNKFECGAIGACERYEEIEIGSTILSDVHHVSIERVLVWHSIGPENLLRALAEAPLCRRGPREDCLAEHKIHTQELENLHEIEKALEGKAIKAKDPTFEGLYEDGEGTVGDDDDSEGEGVGDGSF